jgi:hypothetical protein
VRSPCQRSHGRATGNEPAARITGSRVAARPRDVPAALGIASSTRSLITSFCGWNQTTPPAIASTPTAKAMSATVLRRGCARVTSPSLLGDRLRTVHEPAVRSSPTSGVPLRKDSPNMAVKVSVDLAEATGGGG